MERFKWKRMMGIGMAILMMSSFFFTAGAEGEENSHQDEISFSLKEVVTISLANNHYLDSLDYYIRTKQVELAEKKTSAARLDEKKVTNLDLGKIKYFLPYDAEVQVEIAKIDQEEKENEIALSAVQAYMDLYYMDKGVEVMDKAVKRAEEQVKIAELNYQLGMNTKADLLAAEVQLSKTKSQLEEMRNNRLIKMMQLNQVMGRPLQKEIKIIDPPENPQLPEPEKAIQAGLAYSTALKKQNSEKSSLEKLLEVTKKYRTENTYAVESVQAALKTKQAAIDETFSKVELGLRSLQFQIDSKYASYQVMKQQVNKIEETYRIMVVQYKEGLTSYQELLNTDLLLQQTELDAIRTYIDYQKSLYEYEMMIGNRIDRN